MKKSPFLLLAVLGLVVLLGCAGAGSDAADDASRESIDQERGREASRKDSAVATLLTDLCGMAMREILEVDDYRQRLGRDHYDVQMILEASAARFSKEMEGFCHAEGKVAELGTASRAIMVLDLEADLVSLARYDSASATVESWIEKEGAELPEILKQWMEQFAVAGE